METMQTAAIETAIAIKARCLSLYRAVTKKVMDAKTRRVFEQLAKDEANHLETFCKLYQGSENELITIIGSNTIHADPYFCMLLNSVDGDAGEKVALRIALAEKLNCIDSYAVFVETIREPDIREVFAQILHDSRTHGEIIEQEYLRIMNMSCRTDQELYACQ